MSVQTHDLRPTISEAKERPLPIQAALISQREALRDLDVAMDRIYDAIQPLLGPEVPQNPDGGIAANHAAVDGECIENTDHIRRISRALHIFTDRLRG